jgi:uncharacterized membrane protein YccF (DUF307 family)
MQYAGILELLLALAVLVFLAIISFEVWLVRLSLAIISRTPVLRKLVPVEARETRRRVPRFQLMRQRTWWRWHKEGIRKARGE